MKEFYLKRKNPILQNCFKVLKEYSIYKNDVRLRLNKHLKEKSQVLTAKILMTWQNLAKYQRFLRKSEEIIAVKRDGKTLSKLFEKWKLLKMQRDAEDLQI